MTAFLKSIHANLCASSSRGAMASESAAGPTLGGSRVRRCHLAWLALAVGIIVAQPPCASARLVTDAAGRQVEIKDNIERVMAAGPPAMVLLLMLSPEKLVGFTRKPRPAELAFLPPVARKLTEIGRLTGRGDTANIEVVMNANPDVIIDFGAVTETYIELANRVQKQTGIPYLLFDGRFAHAPEALRLIGDILGVADRAGQLGRYAEQIFAEVDAVVAAVPISQRPRVYLARGATGLETGTQGSINTEVIERAGGRNVADLKGVEGRLVTVSLETVLSWNPDTIVSIDGNFVESVGAAAGWSQIDAVRAHRVFLSPSLPYGWIDSPPSLNRLVGLRWLAQLFFPASFGNDLRRTAKDFYARFYRVDLTDKQLDQLFNQTRE